VAAERAFNAHAAHALRTPLAGLDAQIAVALREAPEPLQGRLERIRAGAAPDAWSDLFDALRRKFPVATLQTAGLVLAKQDGKGHYDRFRNRAIFPIANESGKVVAFGARSLDGSEPKYLNSPETPVYQKSRILYGLSSARDAIRQEGHAVLMEGYLDVARALDEATEAALAAAVPPIAGGSDAAGPAQVADSGSMHAISRDLFGDAPACDTCGGLMVRNGTCYKCLNCGGTSGCS